MLSGLRYCNNSDGKLFKGFIAQFLKSNGESEVLEFGAMDNADNAVDANNCGTVPGLYSPIEDDITNFAIYADKNDIEGLYFVT